MPRVEEAGTHKSSTQHLLWECCHHTRCLQTLPRFEDDPWRNILAASWRCLIMWKTLPEGLKTIFLFWFELPWIQMSLTGNRPSLLVDKPQVLRLKKANPCRVTKLNSGLETFKIIWKLGLSVLPLSPSDYPSQCRSLVKHPRTYSIHLAGPHVIIFFEIVTTMSTEDTITVDIIMQVQGECCPYLHIRQSLESEFFADASLGHADAEFKRQTQDQKCFTLFSRHHFIWHAFQEYFHFGWPPKPYTLYIKLKLRSSYQSCQKPSKIFNCI